MMRPVNIVQWYLGLSNKQTYNALSCLLLPVLKKGTFRANVTEFLEAVRAVYEDLPPATGKTLWQRAASDAREIFGDHLEADLAAAWVKTNAHTGWKEEDWTGPRWADANGHVHIPSDGDRSEHTQDDTAYGGQGMIPGVMGDRCCELSHGVQRRAHAAISRGRGT
jgi:hypothetical protein